MSPQKNDLLDIAIAGWEDGDEVVQKYRFFEHSDRPEELLSISVAALGADARVGSVASRFCVHFAFMVGSHPQVTCDGENLTAEEVFAIIAKRLPAC